MADGGVAVVVPLPARHRPAVLAHGPAAAWPAEWRVLSWLARSAVHRPERRGGQRGEHRRVGGDIARDAVAAAESCDQHLVDIAFIGPRAGRADRFAPVPARDEQVPVWLVTAVHGGDDHRRALTVHYRGRLLLPLLGQVTTTGYVDRLRVRLVPGQAPDDCASCAGNLAHGFGAQSCRIRTAAPGSVVVELVRRDALSQIIPALPVPGRADLRAVPVGRREDGTPWSIRLHGSHVLLAGSTGAGKASLLWGIIRGILPALSDGTVKILGADPKLMELAYGRALFENYGRYESDPEQIVGMLEDAVAGMQDRAGKLAGRQRDHQPTTEHPFTVVVVDEVAFLTAYQPDRKLRERALAAIATLTTQGRAVGYCVVAALQDPCKDVLTIRNLFPDRIAMRLDEPEQVDMVLGDGSRDRGATADLIPADPATGAGVAYVRVDPDPDPVRVRAAWVTNDDITAMCDERAPAPVLRAVEDGAAA
ncbi:MAG: cell division protein FtsK [Actinobacteria bacterium]|nr:cell division protein FtsK [Actinomycetota bacterium]